MTGTPDGVGPVVAGDLMHCELEGVGVMDVTVRNA
jgi:2,4-diketo-3-deoxy-L-fuconate hydrolase